MYLSSGGNRSLYYEQELRKTGSNISSKVTLGASHQGKKMVDPDPTYISGYKLLVHDLFPFTTLLMYILDRFHLGKMWEWKSQDDLL